MICADCGAVAIPDSRGVELKGSIKLAPMLGSFRSNPRFARGGIESLSSLVTNSKVLLVAIPASRGVELKAIPATRWHVDLRRSNPRFARGGIESLYGHDHLWSHYK